MSVVMTREKENKMEKRYPSKRATEKEAWYRKSPSWKFWDRKDYAELPCLNEGCAWALEVYSPYNSELITWGWRAEIALHSLECEYAPKEKPVKKVVKKAVAKKAVKKIAKKNGS
jgi:hypothetical protein